MLELDNVSLSYSTKNIGGASPWRFKSRGKYKKEQTCRIFRYHMSADTSSCHAILGKSGSGKSTLLGLVGGYLQATSGDIRWAGQSIIQLPPDLRPVTSLFQDHNLFEHLSVADNISLGLNTSLKLDKQQQAQLLDVLEKVGLKGFGKRFPTELSGGEQQRVALARCLVRQRPIFLLDEPFSALDEHTRLDMLALTKSIIDAEGLCTLLVTHNQDDAIALGASLCFMENDSLRTPPTNQNNSQSTKS